MEPTSSTCAAASLTCNPLALAVTGLIIIGLAIFYKKNQSKIHKPSGNRSSSTSKASIKEFPSSTKKNNNQKEEGKLEDNFSLLLITTSDKLRDKIKVGEVINGNYNQPVQLETVKNLINTSRYFLVDNTGSGTLQAAKTSNALPDLEKDNLFILKITGQGKHNISTCKTKLALRDSITSESCKIEKVLHLLDARIAEKFVPTI